MPLNDPASWLDIATQPVVGITATICVYWFALKLNRACRGHPIANPTLVAILALGAVLRVSGVSYAGYAQSAGVISFLLSPAVVLLAVPLFRNRQLIVGSGPVIVGALAIGMPTGVLSAVGFAWLCGADRQIILSLAPKTTTAGIAIGISERIGGVPALTAAFVIMTGIVGAICAPTLARLFRIQDQRAIGLGLGISAHGIGTARALQTSDVAGAFAGLGMGLNGVLTALALPIALKLW